MKYLLALLISIPAVAAEKAPKVTEQNWGCAGADCCVTGIEWKIQKDTPVTSKPGSGKQKAAVKAGEGVQAIETLTRSFRGTVVLDRDQLDYKQGYELPYYSTGYDGFTVYYWNGKEIVDSKDVITGLGKIKKASKAKTYIRVKTKSGKEGWVPLEKIEPSC